MEVKGIKKMLLAAAIFSFIAIGSMQEADACTRILWNDNGLVIVVGRTMDWGSSEPVITVFPRGMKRNGGRVGSVEIIKNNPLTWTTKYGSLVTTIYGVATVDGFNERGLAAHMLYLTATDFGHRDPSKPGVHAGLWAQYLLDNAATVKEALALLNNVQLVMAEARGAKAIVHLAIEDASGDSAIIEYIGGKQVVHHGHEFKILTNDPIYDEQLALLKKKDFSKLSSDTPLPGNVKATDRFQRAAFYLAILPKPKTAHEAVVDILAITRNVSVPFCAPYYKGFGIYSTEYRTVTDLTSKRYFFELTTSPNMFWADLTKFRLAPGSPVMVLDPDNIALSGNVSCKFRKAAKVPF
jgi:penicillin V acylase-like amidase (Ntn superfamily)